MQTVDIHSHLLNREVKFDRFYDRLAVKFFAKRLGMEIEGIYKDPYQAYIKALTKNIRESKYLKKAVVFGVDSKRDSKGRVLHRDKTVCATNEDLLTLYENNKDIIIPFFSINPNRPDALDLIDYYYEKGFRGAKFLQNYWNVDTREERYLPYFEKLKSKNLTLIIHVGSESSVSSHKECESLEMLEAPLRVGVKVIAAHMGIEYEMSKIFKSLSKNPKNFGKNYFKLLEMLKEHNNLYADISALLTPVRAKVLRDLSQREEIHEKILFGTDFPVPFSVIFNSYDMPFEKRWQISKIKNPHDRYISAILEYFDKDSPIFTNYKKLLA